MTLVRSVVSKLAEAGPVNDGNVLKDTLAKLRAMDKMAQVWDGMMKRYKSKKRLM